MADVAACTACGARDARLHELSPALTLCASCVAALRCSGCADAFGHDERIVAHRLEPRVYCGTCADNMPQSFEDQIQRLLDRSVVTQMHRDPRTRALSWRVYLVGAPVGRRRERAGVPLGPPYASVAQATSAAQLARQVLAGRLVQYAALLHSANGAAANGLVTALSEAAGAEQPKLILPAGVGSDA